MTRVFSSMKFFLKISISLNKKIYHTNIDQFHHNLFMKYYSININLFYYYRQKYMNLKLVTLFLALHGWMSLVGLSSMSILGLSSMSSIGFCSWSITPLVLVGGLADQKFSFLKISHHMLMSESEKKIELEKNKTWCDLQKKC